MDINYMKFGETTVGYDDSSRTTVLEYAVEASRLRQEDRIIQYAGQNYSVTGKKAQHSHKKTNTFNQELR